MNVDALKKIKANHLNSQQQKAVLTAEGRILILAGAGSGKTSTLSYRMAHLTENLGISETSILGLTFTNKAAQEMRERVSKIIPKEKARKMTLCTFHSFCMQVLRDHIERLGYTKKFSLYDEQDMKRLTTQITKSVLDHEGPLPSLDSTIHLLTEIKQKGFEQTEHSELTSGWQKKFVKDLHEQLELSLRAYNAVDFDSLISLTVKLFSSHPDLLELYQNRYRFLMIDEYQDTNPMQYQLASLLSEKHGNLCVVGDDDQSIYGWRGAEVKHILKFNYDTLIKLEQNYRSSKNILDAANHVIKNNKERHEKTLWSHTETLHPVTVFHAPTDVDEAKAVIQRMLQLRSEHGYLWKDMAILYRSNQLSRVFEIELMQTSWKDKEGWKRGIPYQVFGGEELFQRSEIKDLFAYLKVINNPLDQESLLRVINYPRRGIAEKTLDLLTKKNRADGISLWDLLLKVQQDDPSYQELIHEIPTKAFQGICSFTCAITKAKEDFESLSMPNALENLIERIDYKKAIEEEVKTEKMQSFKWDNVQSCVQLLTQYENSQDSKKTLEEFLSTLLLDEKKFSKQNDHFSDHVNLLTFHSAKGLEFPICFLVGIEDHLIPHEKSLKETGLEEERRLMYVALTRCKQRLFLSMARTRKRHGKEMPSSPSRFLFEIPKELLATTSWKDPL